MVVEGVSPKGVGEIWVSIPVPRPKDDLLHHRELQEAFLEGGLGSACTAPLPPDALLGVYTQTVVGRCRIARLETTPGGSAPTKGGTAPVQSDKNQSRSTTAIGFPVYSCTPMVKYLLSNHQISCYF